MSELTKPRHYDSAFAMPPNQPFILLDAKNAFEKLTEREKLYSHHLARASFFGGLIVLVQTSPESPQVRKQP
jgi:dipeptidyl-peptidase-3